MGAMPNLLATFNCLLPQNFKFSLTEELIKIKHILLKRLVDILWVHY